jgi:hypothetical protein
MNINVLLQDVPLRLQSQMRTLLLSQYQITRQSKNEHFGATVLAMVKEIFDPKKCILWDISQIIPMSYPSETFIHGEQKIQIEAITKAFSINYYYENSNLLEALTAAERI